jgi:hypothetical protein
LKVRKWRHVALVNAVAGWGLRNDAGTAVARSGERGGGWRGEFSNAGLLAIRWRQPLLTLPTGRRRQTRA